MDIFIRRQILIRFSAAVVLASFAISGGVSSASRSMVHGQPSAAEPDGRYAQYPAPPGYPPPPPGYSPPPPPPPCPAVTPSPLRGAARGAAGGAMFGAIAGDAGKGAAVGAAVGGVGAAARRGSARAAGACY